MSRARLGLIVLIGMCIIFALLGIGCLFSAFSAWKRWSHLHRNGAVVEGQITERRTTREGKPLPTVAYSYQYGGKTHMGHQDVNDKHAQEWVKGTAVTVHCLPNQPEVATLTDAAQLRFTLSIFLVSAALLLGSTAAFLALIPYIISTQHL